MKSCKELHREKFQEMLEWWSLENLCTVMLCDSAFPNHEAPLIRISTGIPAVFTVGMPFAS